MESRSRKVSQKPEVGSPKSEEKLKAERPKLKAETKPVQKGPSGETENTSAINIPRSELNIASSKSPPPVDGETFENQGLKNNSEIEHPNSEITELPTANSKLQTENMEVHHHPEVEKKGFKEYILEGLMIFLAVTMGFFAETIREGISEHKRAAEFARSYFDDIKKDTAALNAAVNFSRMKLAGLDSALVVLHYPVEKQKDTILYVQLAYSATVMPFDPSQGTYEQIKSSGSLRYFDQKLVNLMNAYDVQVKKTVNRENIDLKFILEQYLPYIIKNFNSEVPFDYRFSHHISHELYITDRSVTNIRQQINYVVDIKIERLLAMKEYARQKQISAEVLAELHKEYELE